MGRVLTIETIRPGELRPGERALWAGFRAAQPALASPYFDVRYALAADEVCPNAQVAVLHRGGRIDGFFPFQTRGGLIQPLGAPLTDYHGVISRPGVTFDLGPIIQALGGSRFHFSGLKVADAPKRAAVHRSMVADLSRGFDAYLEGRRFAGQSDFLKDKRRRLRALERDHGPVEFTLGADDPGALGAILRLKREQMARAGQHDIFDCGWTERLLRRLLEHEDKDFGARIAILRTGTDIAATELGLLSDAAYHLWFPVYDPAYARYSPGQLMTLQTLKALAGQGVRSVDFGPAGEAYKRAFADPGEAVYEGDIVPGGFRPSISAALGLRDQRQKLGRRLDRIVACEPTLPRRMVATSKYLGVVARRHPAAAATAGAIGLGLGLGLLTE